MCFSVYLLVIVAVQQPMAAICQSVQEKLLLYEGDDPRKFQALVRELCKAFELLLRALTFISTTVPLHA